MKCPFRIPMFNVACLVILLESGVIMSLLADRGDCVRSQPEMMIKQFFLQDSHNGTGGGDGYDGQDDFEMGNFVEESQKEDARQHAPVIRQSDASFASFECSPKTYQDYFENAGDKFFLVKAPAETDFVLRTLANECEARPNPTVFDVGAHYGHTLLRYGFLYGTLASDLLSTKGMVDGHGRSGLTVHAFEPSEFTYKQLKENLEGLKYPGLTIHNKAVSNFTGVANFSIRGEGAENNGFRKSDAIDYVSVNVTSLDAVIKEHKVTWIPFAKIDAEGHDHLVIRGMHEALRDHKVGTFMFEYGSSVHDINFTETIATLADFGYQSYIILNEEVSGGGGRGKGDGTTTSNGNGDGTSVEKAHVTSGKKSSRAVLVRVDGDYFSSKYEVPRFWQRCNVLVLDSALDCSELLARRFAPRPCRT